MDPKALGTSDEDPRLREALRIAEEDRQIKQHLEDGADFETCLYPLACGSRAIPNPILTDRERSLVPGPESRHAITTDVDLLQRVLSTSGRVPGFVGAGPRATLHFDPAAIHVGIVTSGGVCPGLNTVVDEIVRRHALYATRHDPSVAHPTLLGLTNGFRGFIEGTYLHLTPSETENWPRRGGSRLRQLRETAATRPDPQRVLEAIRRFELDILYIAGGDGSLRTAQLIQGLLGPDDNLAIVHIPKTMDNDIPWVTESFGFQTAIAEAARLVSAIRDEAESNNRIAIVEVMGAGMGHTAAYTALASGEVDAVLVPEQGPIDIDLLADHLHRRALGSGRKGFAVVLAAEKVRRQGPPDANGELPGLDLGRPSGSILVQALERRFKMKGVDSRVFVNQPRHFIRAVPANCQDQLYCRQLANGAVDGALAGYTGFSISKWLDQYVMVPFARTAGFRKHLPLDGMVWKQVVNLTGQPDLSDSGFWAIR